MPGFSELASGLGQKWNELDPILKTTLLGAGASGIGAGALSAMSPTPASPEGRKARRKRIITNAGLAAILGGGATAGIGYGLKNLGEVMPKGSKPPGEAARDAITGPWGRAGLFGVGATLGGLRESGKAKGSVNLLTELLGAKTQDRGALSAFERAPLRTSTADAGMRAHQQMKNLSKMTGGMLDRNQVVDKLVQSGIDIDPDLLKPGKLKSVLKTKVVGRPIGKLLALLRRRGPGKMVGAGAGLALLPELLGGVGSVWNAATGGGDEGTL